MISDRQYFESKYIISLHNKILSVEKNGRSKVLYLIYFEFILSGACILFCTLYTVFVRVFLLRFLRFIKANINLILSVAVIIYIRINKVIDFHQSHCTNVSVPMSDENAECLLCCRLKYVRQTVA